MRPKRCHYYAITPRAAAAMRDEAETMTPMPTPSALRRHAATPPRERRLLSAALMPPPTPPTP